MTSDEIRVKDTLAMDMQSWLKEIAYQLALLNEKPLNDSQRHNQQRPKSR